MVAKKMNNLRSAFRKEHKKDISSLRSGASADDIYQPSVWYYEQLLFLQDQETPRQSVTNVMIMFAHHALLQEHLRQLEQVEEVRIPRVIPRDRANPFRYHTEEDFVKRYRLPKNAVQDLIEAIEPHAPRPNNDRGCSIPLFLQMLVTLKYLATGSFQLSVADCVDMAVSPVCRCVGRISQLIAYLAPDYIKFPTPAEGHRLAQKYFSVPGYHDLKLKIILSIMLMKDELVIGWRMLEACSHAEVQPPAKKRRAANFSEEELMLLIEEVAERKAVLLGPLTSVVTNKGKELAWKAVAEAINSVGVVQRNVSDIKKKWFKVKSEVKCKAAKEKSERSKTGSGVAEPTVWKPTEEAMLALIESEAIEGFSSLESGTINPDRPQPSTSAVYRQPTGTLVTHVEYISPQPQSSRWI
ncbi:hypothetical protein Pcinc_006238 [Petrolisthes cinctipes]|uniref:Regulatory protein zeste n=1 Tax=Petrolisthes cinctipes TaxID=88211 RepID=A0AAE1KZN5_PETCI|nr:hypothetical protein Pcinc_006238 [Petrolisthes cinctipes]